MTGPEQHAATVLRALSWEAPTPEPDSWGGERAEARDALDELVALAGRADGLQARLRDAESVTTSGLVTRLMQRAEAAEARADVFERDQAATAEEWRREQARADELQRELAWTKGTASRHLDAAYRTAAEKLVEARREADRLDRLSADMSATLVQTQREADQLRAALEKIVACDYRGNMPPEQSIARAALAGVQADNKDSA